MSDPVVLFETDDASGYRRETVKLKADGSLIIEGHDLGPVVEQFWGRGLDEYEFVRTVPPPEVARLRKALGLQRDDALLAALHQRFESAHELEVFLKEHGVESEFWNRVGS